MKEREDMLTVISSGDIQSIAPKEIDAAISQMIQVSKENGEELQQLALECSSALASAQGRTAALDSQGRFKRLWNNITGKNEKLRCAIERDNVAAQYAMQQTITGVLAECVRNQELTLAVKFKLEREIQRIETYQVGQDRELNRTRQALVAFYKGYLEQNAKIYEELERRDIHAGKRCEYCRRELSKEQIVCPQCGTIQELKLEKLPMKMQEKIKQLSALMKKPLEEWNPDIYWDMTAKKYADIMAKAKKLLKSDTLLNDYSSLEKDIDILIKKCRNAEFQIAVVGVLKDGKSTLMNALIGLDLASTGINSETAALTKFRSSAEGHQVKVSFYTADEWKELCDSAQKSEKSGNSDSLWSEINQPEVQQRLPQYIGKPELLVPCADIDTLRAEIQKWTSAKSYLHVFAAEVEVSIDRNVFKMPSEVVFVDTPGLKDTVKYRSRITERYIDNADAVLVATMLPGGFGQEKYETVTTALDHVGKGKVYIAGTELDRLNSEKDLQEKLYGKGGMVSTLSCKYDNRDEAREHVIPTSAYLQIALDKYLKDQDLEKEERRALKHFIEDKWDDRYGLADLKDHSNLVAELEDTFGIKILKSRLEKNLINRAKTLKLKSISKDYIHCRDGLLRVVENAANDRNALVRAAEGDMEQLQRKYEEAEKLRQQAEKSEKQISECITQIKQYTQETLDALSNATVEKARNLGKSSKAISNISDLIYRKVETMTSKGDK